NSNRSCSGAVALQVQSTARDFDYIAAHEDAALGVHMKEQRRRARDVFALGYLQLARQRLPGRNPPAAEVRGSRSCCWILENGRAVGKEKSRQRAAIGRRREDVCHALAIFA